MERDATIIAAEIMRNFARDTGIDPEGATPRRYLWTDAFAVCNFLELYRRTGEGEWKELAVRLVRQVHRVLGRHRPDSGETGWISGLSEAEGENHPTARGLRIGKELPERPRGEPINERLEWDRDGQYYHYLTKWMHALSRMSSVTGAPAYLGWGIELAVAVYPAFSHETYRGGKGLYWKMSVDLSRPQVTSMGMHDPLDGLITSRELLWSAAALGIAAPPYLGAQIGELSALCRGMEWETNDPLGLGGLLCDAWRMAQLMAKGEGSLAPLFEEVAAAARHGLEECLHGGTLELPASCRLPFREFGLAIGVHALEALEGAATREGGAAQLGKGVQNELSRLREYLPLAGRIENFWLEEKHRKAGTWREHADINSVMLATSLLPKEFLTV